jgi:hypothetical protein
MVDNSAVFGASLDLVSYEFEDELAADSRKALRIFRRCTSTLVVSCSLGSHGWQRPEAAGPRSLSLKQR